MIISSRLEYKKRRQGEGASKEEIDQELEEIKQEQEELDGANRGYLAGYSDTGCFMNNIFENNTNLVQKTFNICPGLSMK